MKLPSDRKAVLRRVWIFAGVIVFVLAAIFLTFHSNRVSRKTLRQQSDIAENGTQTLRVLLSLQSECATAVASYEEVDREVFRAHVSELVQDATEDGSLLAALYADLGLEDYSTHLRADLQELEARWQEVLQKETLEREDIVLVSEDTRRLEDTLLAADAASHAVINDQAQYSQEVDAVAWGCLLVTVGLGVTGVVLVISDLLNEALTPVDVEGELKMAEESPELQYRLQKLLAETPSTDECDSRWSLELTKVMRRHRTHITFEAVAVRGEHRVKLWGKRYRWAGVIKSFQRVFEPGFGKGSWKIVRRMYNQKLDCPFPVTCRRLKHGPWTVGSILLTEHVGDLTQVKTFLKTQFVFMDDDGRMRFLKRMIAWWNSLHSIGLHSLSPRYLHGKRLGDPERKDPVFYLCDLDKVGMSWGSGGTWHKLCLALDNRRLRRWLKTNLTGREIRECERLLDRDPEGPTDSA